MEGENVRYLRCEQKEDIPKTLKSISEKPVDLVFTVTTPATKQSKKALSGKNIPIVFAMQDPVNSGVIHSLADPGKLISGVQIRGSVHKALEWLVKMVPDVRHIVIPIRYDTGAAKQSLADLQVAAGQANIQLTIIEVDNRKELIERLTNMPSDTDAIFLLHSMLTSTYVKDICAITIAKKIPVGSAIHKTDEGVLFTFSPELAQMGKQASRLAQQF